MPTTIDSAGITFNDTTSLTSANIGTAQLVNGSVIASKLGTTEQKQIAKAWVNFNGTTSPGTIRSSFNVSSITKNAVGDYTVNFATPMADANYSANVTGATPTASVGIVNITRGNPTTSLIYVASSNSVGLADTTFVGVAIFGN